MVHVTEIVSSRGRDFPRRQRQPRRLTAEAWRNRFAEGQERIIAANAKSGVGSTGAFLELPPLPVELHHREGGRTCHSLLEVMKIEDDQAQRIECSGGRG